RAAFSAVAAWAPTDARAQWPGRRTNGRGVHARPWCSEQPARSPAAPRYAAQARARQGKKRSMRHTRIIVTHYGGPDALRVVEEECPQPKAGEVRGRGLAARVALAP